MQNRSSSGHASCMHKMVVQSPAQMILDQLVGGAISLLDGSLTLQQEMNPSGGNDTEQVAALATRILTLTWSAGSVVPAVVKQLLASLHPSRAAYHDYKDRVLLTQVVNDLKLIQDEQSVIYLDPEAFYNVLCITKTVASSQPHNLIRFTRPAGADGADDADDDAAAAADTGRNEFIDDLLRVGQRLHSGRARNPLLSPVGQLGLVQVRLL